MASNILSRILPTTYGEPSIYETLRQYDDHLEYSDSGDRHDDSINEEYDNEPSQYYEREEETSNHQSSSDVMRGGVDEANTRYGASGTTMYSRKNEMKAEENDNEVPQSLLIEDEYELGVLRELTGPGDLPLPVPGPSSKSFESRSQQHNARPKTLDSESRAQRTRPGRPISISQPKERAAWMWANVQNLDQFMIEVYEYYVGHGIWSILLSRAVRLLTLAFVVAFTTFLTSCVDYKKLPDSKSMTEILIPRCTRNMSTSANVMLWLIAVCWIYKVFDYCQDIRRLRSMQNFYTQLLGIPDSDMQTVSWQEVVKKLMSLRDLNSMTSAKTKEAHRRFLGTQSKQSMDAHDIANRIMRRDNYFIALINKDVLDFTLPIPFLRNRQLFSKTLEWNLQYCILDFVFNEKGQVRSLFLKDSHRRGLSQGIRSRFLFAGFISLICAPFVVVYYVLVFFFRYFTEFQRNPSQIGSRQYTPFAEWKFREFNELQHLFERRLNMSYPYASRYVDQFPKDKTMQISSLVAFITGALASVLAVASLIDPESFLAFEITNERTVLFYLGVFGTIWAMARANMPEENLVFDPEYALTNVTEYTHYVPNTWKGRLHTNEVRAEFAQLYQTKVYIFIEELLSIVLAPLVLWISLPNCCDRIVDFFREFTIHVDGMGYVCSFAVFDFKKGAPGDGRLDEAVADDLRAEYYSTKGGKMMASYYGFKDAYGPNPRLGGAGIYHTGRQSFVAPPTFPGLMSGKLPIIAPYEHDIRTGPSKSQYLSHGSVRVGTGAPDQVISRKAPHFAKANTHSSSIASMLLNTNGPPIRGSTKSQKRAGVTRSRLGTSRGRFDYHPEDKSEDRADQDRDLGSIGTDLNTGASNLGGSWKTTRAGHRDDDEDDAEGSEDASAIEDKRPGVLGLVYGLSKAQTDGRPGVNI